MGMIDRPTARVYAATAFCLISFSARTQPLTEYQLAAVAQPTDIDATFGDAFFLDPGTQNINRISGGVLTQWSNFPCVLNTVDKIAVSNAIFSPSVYFTSNATNRICILDSTNGVLFWWTLPPVVGNPRTLSVDAAGTAWYSSTPSAGPAAIGALDPTMNVVKLWLLPPGIAAPGDVIDGLVFANNQLYFTVAGSQSTICVMNPVPNPSPTSCYPIPVNAPAPIRVNAAGDIYRLAGSGSPQILRLRPAATLLTTWSTPNNPDLFLSPGDRPYFTTVTGEVEMLDPTVPGLDMLDPPGLYSVYSDYLSAAANGIISPGTDSVPGTSSVALSSSSSGAFTIWSPITSSGPVSIDPVGAVWISEKAASRIATFQP